MQKILKALMFMSLLVAPLSSCSSSKYKSGSNSDSVPGVLLDAYEDKQYFRSVGKSGIEIQYQNPHEKDGHKVTFGMKNNYAWQYDSYSDFSKDTRVVIALGDIFNTYYCWTYNQETSQYVEEKDSYNGLLTYEEKMEAFLAPLFIYQKYDGTEFHVKSTVATSNYAGRSSIIYSFVQNSFMNKKTIMFETDKSLRMVLSWRVNNSITHEVLSVKLYDVKIPDVNASPSNDSGLNW